MAWFSMHSALIAPVLLISQLCFAAVPDDLVEQLPGFEKTPFKAYSGYLAVPGPFALSPDIDALKIHYQLHLSQQDPSKDPVVTWHQGGPGGSSISVGLYTEMGYFQTDDKGFHTNPHAWNNVANMLYLESPAGSGSNAGYSVCLKAGKPVKCTWDDKSQAEAYAHSLYAFFKAYPEFSKNPLHLTGESYFGQYGPNIAHYILNNEPFASALNLKGIALGNACWGGNETTVQCNGPFETRNDLELYFGKGLIGPKLYQKAHAVCSGPEPPDGQGAGIVSQECHSAMSEVAKAMGPFNIYDLYDDCPTTGEWLARAGKDMHWLHNYLRTQIWRGNFTAARAELLELGGGFDWSCGGEAAAEKYLLRPDVRKALHLGENGLSAFAYTLSGPASITLYPELIKKIRVFIYNGDADACVPYIGNEEWIAGLEAKGQLVESTPWQPWFAEGVPQTPAGYETEYSVPGSEQHFSFFTVRLAGHMVPTFQPQAALTLFKRFIASSADASAQPVASANAVVV